MRLSLALPPAKGMAHLDPLLERIQADESLPLAARELFAVQSKEYRNCGGKSTRLKPNSRLGIRAMNAANGSSRFPASVRSARFC